MSIRSTKTWAAGIRSAVWPTHRLAAAAASLAMLVTLATALAPESRAQAPILGGSGGVPFTGDSLRLWHKTAGYGQDDSHTAAGGRVSAPLDDGILFLDGQFKMADSDQFGANIGGGARWFYESLFTGSDRLMGLSGWYDGEETSLDNYFNQAGVSFESLGDRVDIRVNGNFPTDGDKISEQVFFSDDLRFAGNLLIEDALTTFEVPLTVVDYEVAVRALESQQIWIYGGGYSLDGTGVSTSGYKIGARGNVTNDLIVDLSVSDDNEFGTNTLFSIVWFPGRSTATPKRCLHGFERRILDPVFRNNYVTIDRQQRASLEALRDDDGEAFMFVHVDSNAVAPGDGTFEMPLTSLDDVEATSDPGNVVFVHGGSVHNGESVTLQNEQRLLGEGLRPLAAAGDGIHTVSNSTRGVVPLPETSPGAQSGPAPIINNAPGDAIVINQTGDPLLTGVVEIANLTIDGGARAISDVNGAGDININRLDIANTTGNAIELTPLVENLANGSQRVRFRPVVDRVNFDSVGGDDVDFDAAHGVANPSQVLEQLAVVDSTSVNGQGVSVNFANNTVNAFVIRHNYDGGANGSGGVLLTGAEGNLNVQDSEFANGAGPGIEIRDSAGTHAITTSNVSDTGNAGLLVEGGDANANLNGVTISQNSTADAVRFAGGHTGTVAFGDDAGDPNDPNDDTPGLIRATNGDGIQFNNADGTYTFNSRVELEGGNAGIDMTNGTAGTITFANAVITNPSGTAVNVAGGAGDLTFTGEINQANSSDTLFVSNGHTGTLTFNDATGSPNPVISATDGDGLQFDNADGVYVFNGEVNLSGGNAGIDLLNGADGTFTFADTEIDNPTGVALNVNGGAGSVTFTGKITQTANNASAVSVANGHTGTLIFNEGTGGDGVVEATMGNGLQFNNADGAYTFNDAVTLSGGNAGIDVLNGSEGTFVFDAASAITNPSGDALVVNGSSAVVTYSGTITNSNANTVTIDGNNGGDVVIAGAVNGTNQGAIEVQNNTGGNFRFAGPVNLNTGDNPAVAITMNAGGGTRFDDLTIVTDDGAAFTATDSDTVEVAGAGNTITTTGGVALNLNNVVVGPVGVNFREVNADGGASAIQLNNVSGGTVAIGVGGTSIGDGGLIQNTTSSAVVATNVENLSLNNMSISGAGADAVVIDLNGMNTSSNVTLSNNGVNGGANRALLLTGNDATPKEIRVLATGNNFANDANLTTAEFQANDNTELNATILTNTFANANAGVNARPMAISTNDVAASVHLNLNGNSGTAGNGGDIFFLENNAGTFTVNSLGTISADNNNAGVSQSGVITGDNAPVPQP